VLLLLVVALAALAAAFPIANSDFFMSLATGRLLAQGEYQWGVDPFTFTSEGVYWVNHSWLYDLVVYWIYQVPQAGQYLLTLAKALGIGLTAWFMIRTGKQPGERWFIASACALLGVLALSPRLFMGSILVSIFLLALTVLVLKTATEEGQRRRLYLLPVLCLLWVNLDAWFLLGPLTIAFFFLGELLQPLTGPTVEPENKNRSMNLQTLGLVFFLSLTACLANPHFAKAFTLPPALGFSEAAKTLGTDRQFRGLYLSPWELRYLAVNTGLSAGGLAFYPLALAGLISFGLTFGSWKWWRALCWLAFGGLASWNSRFTPFFAVVAAPVTALNFQDFARTNFGLDLAQGRRLTGLALGGRILCLVLCVGLLVATIPGWLQATPHHLRRVGWGVQPDQSLRNAALQINAWHDQGLVETGNRWFNTTPEVVSYLAWYSPGQRGFLDHRLQLFGAVAKDYAAVRQALEGPPPQTKETSTQEKPEETIARILDRQKVRFVVYHAQDPGRQREILARFYSNPSKWAPCHGWARTAIFGHMPAGKAGPFANVATDFSRQAFGPKVAETPAWSPRVPRRCGWWTDLYRARPPRADEADTVYQHIVRFDSQLKDFAQRSATNWQAMIFTSIVASAGFPGDAVTNGTMFPVRLTGAMRLISEYVETKDLGPVDSLYLGLRAGRRALSLDPNNARNNFLLAEIYGRLVSKTEEKAYYGRALPLLGAIRQSQVAYLLNKALELNPPPALAQHAHLVFTRLYQGPEYFEPRVHHYKQYLRYTKMVGSIAGVPPEHFAEELDRLEKSVREQDQQLKSRRDDYEVNAVNRDVLTKARLALEKGLAQTALDKILLKADVAELAHKNNPDYRGGAAQIIQLLLGMGRLEEADEGLNPRDESAKFDRKLLGRLEGIPAYEYFQIQLAAGWGNYEAADKILKKLIADSVTTPQIMQDLATLDILSFRQAANESGRVSDLAAFVIGKYLLDEALHSLKLPFQFRPHLPLQLQPPFRPRMPSSMISPNVIQRRITDMLKEEVNLRTLRGWLALEAGKSALAKQELGLAVAHSQSGNLADGKLFVWPIPSRGLAVMGLTWLDKAHK
jgi:hypothetical protein